MRADVAVVGAGAAGLYTALTAAGRGAQVALISSSPLGESASYHAQGGIAAAIGPGDSPARHLEDTLAAGRGASRESAARVLCEESPARVRELIELGVGFDAESDGTLGLGREGGHSARRVVHAGGSATGRSLTRELSGQVGAHPRIAVFERTTAIALWVRDGRCVGLVARASTGGAGNLRVVAPATVVATGGGAALWERTTNPRGAIAAGVSLGHVAGVELADMEFVQFHPTALLLPGPYDGYLVTEAVRGEGATLLDARGERFVDELAPRDEVALAIAARLRDGDGVFLDMRAVDPSRFPNVVATLELAGLDPLSEPVPVAPAAHYTIGGMATDLHARTSLPGLYAVGECSCNGLHGANRLASNSLAECFVFGRRAAEAALEEEADTVVGVAEDDADAPLRGPSPVPPTSTRRGLQRLAGIVRDEPGLHELASDPFPLARLVARGALARTESRGAHRRRDRPDPDPSLEGVHGVFGAGGELRLERWD